MKILLTNDDGIHAEGIRAAYDALTKFADVTIVAPEGEQSSVGHGITLNHPLFVKEVHKNKKFYGYSVSGKPADCVKFAIDVIYKSKPDIVISGINLGANDGCSVFYSGTVAGAREGALLGIKSAAISLNEDHLGDFKNAAKITAKIAKFLYNKTLPKGTFLNVNIPVGNIKSAKLTHQGQDPIHGQFNKRISPHDRVYYWMSGKMPTTSKDLSTDTNALAAGYVTVTPIHCNLTDKHVLSILQKDFRL